ncbi:MAG TPA: peptide chain release factor N(5)-glutamine methyltransferase [Casimicrobiaceae bacterium]|nr:peptide chain release factor N(5)-glutamine methyltransferase [Casimicrobiaceae bacterium]
MISTQTVSGALAHSGLVPLDAQVLLAHALSKERAWLVAHGDAPLTREQEAAFFALAKRRREGAPVAYLVGVREFWGLPLGVTPAVLIPRPDTEALVELALSRIPVDRETRVIDLGTGSGAIALALAHERPRAGVLAVDASSEALAVARDNARRLGIANVEFAQADWYSGLPDSWREVEFDLIVSNPPYVAMHDPHLREGDVRFEPTAALVSGVDGLTAIRQIAAGARAHLAPGGTLAVEHGYDQSERVCRLFAEAGFGEIVTARDLAGIPRVVAGRSLAGA